MLILTRKREQQIMFTCPDGSEISIMVCAVSGDKVRLGITAPREVEVFRAEVKERMLKVSGKAAA